MAYTKIHAIKTTVNKAIDYITNPAKTEGTLLVSGYNCEAYFAFLDFKMTEALAQEVNGDFRGTGGANNLAYHMIQSFAPYDKITAEEAHEIGRKLADEMLQGKHEYVLSTHIDKGQIHNHIIFNAVSFYDYKKFRSEPYKTARKIREISDRLCEEKSLYVIRSPKGKGKSRKEWEARKYGTSWKAKIEAIIDNTIPKAQDYTHFIELLNEAGVEVKEGKHIAFRLQEQQRFVRGKTLGQNYTRENITETIKNKNKLKQPAIEKFDRKIEFIARKQQIAATKELANILVLIRRENIQGVSDFDIKIDELREQNHKVKADIKILDSKNSQYKEVAKYLVAYNKYLPIVKQYQKRSFITKKGFYKKYESELLAFEHALKQLEKLGINTNVDPDKVVELVRQQTQKTTELNSQFKQTESRIDELKKAKEMVQNIIKPEQDQQREKREKRDKEGR